MSESTSYHIYYDDKVLFKNLNLEEFTLIWKKLYRSYHTDSITYSICKDDLCTLEQSY
ncbi:hypothetical protein [Synechococcus phage metaG-MbCM1]|uniref:Uncharacterized protein n=1 Tax=Synechococcus phage metaG-MbCM1 TaxID=1079999 RepID=H8ZN35_9CAUD|nr:hypothetical protein [Synechococcus phage metaG-MbCM1]AFD02896.1 hypothetical protein [Synechococcus phage metaG-MbCM1]